MTQIVCGIRLRPEIKKSIQDLIQGKNNNYKRKENYNLIKIMINMDILNLNLILINMIKS